VHLCTVEECHDPAIAAFRWEWGDEGKCCARHQFLLRQKSGTLQRGIEFAVLDPNATPALTRDERTRFHASILTLEDELRDAKARGLDLYQSNTKIAEEARRLAARNRELEAQLKDATAELANTVDARDGHLADLADATAELDRLRAILPKPEKSEKSKPETKPEKPTQPPEK
jgi:chromosome segregation ATPase